MTESLRRLVLTLERMLSLYQRVLVILRHEKDELVQLKFEGLFEVMREKDEVLSAIRALDKDRLRIQDQIAHVWNMNSEELSLRTLGERLILEGSQESESMGQRLMGLRESLKKVMAEIEDRLRVNALFHERSIRNLQAMAANISQLQSGKKEPQRHATYSGKAKLAESPPSGALLEKRL